MRVYPHACRGCRCLAQIAADHVRAARQSADGEPDQSLPDQFAADGGITLYVQHESPGRDKEANWLPAPRGPVLREYWPKPEALDGTWKAPPAVRTASSIPVVQPKQVV
jgi:hypothetical protein